MSDLERFFQSAGPYLWFLLLLAMVGVGVWLFKVQQRVEQSYGQLDRLVRGQRGDEGLDILLERLRRLEKEAENLDVLQSALRELELRQNRSYQSVGLVRFNPFTDMGGDQSFALAIVDSFGDGFVMSSLHGRTATRIYAKTVKRGQATQTVSNEEQSAIEQAMRYQQMPPETLSNNSSR
ncbi:MAG: DUF4446 family protein [Chloroflexota bacterium]|nr:DUF4446 family protein [Chloroflexota bacterium]